MSLEVRCPNPLCGKVYQVREELAGRSARCHWCGESFRIPRAGEAQVLLRKRREEIGSRKDLVPRRAGLSIAAAGFGIVGLLSSVLIVGMIPGTIAVILGFFGRKKAKDHPEQFGGMGIARAGMAFGVAAIAISITATPAWMGIRGGMQSRLELEMISLAIEDYRREKGGEYPQRLADLQKYTLAKAKLKPFRREVQLEDFTYLKPDRDTPDDAIVLFAKKRYFLLGRAALRNNGESDFISEKELKEALEGQWETM